ncbi:hypothetical protein [Dysgonomonas sp. GY617]|uniref:hypothetical protein n=1 Tax=Dysgonomonas sp. GY617 TaxID=2780420 RepID=UPI00188411C4|nr:hypothetical protein [Dysgonomonas sp. GY617]MBF0576589.1 hypothetical protein [Dysgonomonas sp. GY617]
MSTQDILTLKQTFSDNKEPNGQDFANLIDSFDHKSVPIAQNRVLGLAQSFREKADKSDLDNIVGGMINKGEVVSEALLPVVAQKGWAYIVTAEKDPASGLSYIYQYDGVMWNNTYLTAYPSDVLVQSNITQQITESITTIPANKAVSDALAKKKLTDLIAISASIRVTSNATPLETGFTVGILRAGGTIDTAQTAWKTSDYLTSPTPNGYLFISTIFPSANVVFANAILFDSNKKEIDSAVIIGDRCICVPSDYYVRISTFTANTVYTTSSANGSESLTNSVKRLEFDISKKKLTDLIAISASIRVTSNAASLDTGFSVGIQRADGSIDATQTAWKTSDYLTSPTPNGYLFVSTDFPSANMSVFANVVLFDSNKKEIDSTVIIGDRCICVPSDYYVRISTLTANMVYATSAGNGSESLTTSLKRLEGVGATKTMLAVGTSITIGCTYFVNACKALGYNAINKGIGASGICIAGTGVLGTGRDGLDLSETIAEKEARYAGKVTPAQMETFRNASYERVILPYLDQIDAIFFDHGYNDRKQIYAQLQNEGTIDWNSLDRTTYVGAFNYLMNEILKRKPYMKIIVVGYHEDQTGELLKSGFYQAGAAICKMQKLVAEKYGFPFLNVASQVAFAWNKYIPNSSTFLSDYNTANGTNYVNQNPDANNNISIFQRFAPDAVHPFTDKTGNSNKRLDQVIIRLLRDAV